MLSNPLSKDLAVVFLTIKTQSFKKITIIGLSWERKKTWIFVLKYITLQNRR
jgi:hypothetical protein